MKAKTEAIKKYKKLKSETDNQKFLDRINNIEKFDKKYIYLLVALILTGIVAGAVEYL